MKEGGGGGGGGGREYPEKTPDDELQNHRLTFTYNTPIPFTEEASSDVYPMPKNIQTNLFPNRTLPSVHCAGVPTHAVRPAPCTRNTS